LLSSSGDRPVGNDIDARLRTAGDEQPDQTERDHPRLSHDRFAQRAHATPRPSAFSLPEFESYDLARSIMAIHTGGLSPSEIFTLLPCWRAEKPIYIDGRHDPEDRRPGSKAHRPAFSRVDFNRGALDMRRASRITLAGICRDDELARVRGRMRNISPPCLCGPCIWNTHHVRNTHHVPANTGGKCHQGEH